MRTDGHHNGNIGASLALLQRFRCHSCGVITEPGDILIAHRQYGLGTPYLRLADSGYDPVAEDELICGNRSCGSKDIEIVE
jgi:hypothetical protein